MISNLIHIQQSVRGVETDLPGVQVDVDTDRLMERDENLVSLALDEQQFTSPNGKNVLDPADPSAVAAENRTPDKLENVKFVLSPLPERAFGKIYVQPSQFVCLGKRINGFQL
jgi:hypothetical protein